MTPIEKKFKKISGRFGFLRNKGYILLIKLNYYVKKKHQDCKDICSKKPYQDYLRSCVKQHLPRWVILPCTCECKRTEVQQELLLKEKCCNLPQPIVERVIRTTHNSTYLKSLMDVAGHSVKPWGTFFILTCLLPKVNPEYCLANFSPCMTPDEEDVQYCLAKDIYLYDT
jgi:hypothetical protein